MSDASADQNVEGDQDAGLNLTQEQINFTPPPRNGQEREYPQEYVGAGPVGVQILDDLNIPPINNLLAPEQPLDQGASAGAGTSTPIPVPSQNAARKVPRELQNLATTNKPGYGESGFESNVPRTKRKSLELAKQILHETLATFDEKGEELVQLSEPFHPGNEGAIVSKYAVLEDMIKGLENGASELVELMDEKGATHEVAEVREAVERRQRWLEQQCNKVGIVAMIKCREARSSCSQSITSLTSVQQRKGKIASKKAWLPNREKIAVAELQMKQARIHLQRLKNNTPKPKYPNRVALLTICKCLTLYLYLQIQSSRRG